MINENMKKVLVALRSGRFQQTTGKLSDKKGHCCLGVMCEVAIENGVVLEKVLQEDQKWRYDSDTAVLPEVVRKWVGLNDPTGGYYENNKGYALSGRNDDGATFLEIADTIEREPEGLFIK